MHVLKIKGILNGLALLLLAILLIIGYNYLKDPAHFQIKTVEVDGKLNHLKPEAVAEALTPWVATNFFAVNVGTLQRELSKLAWVHDTQIRRVWPDKVVVNIEEHVPVAVWQDRALVSDRFELYQPDALPEMDLPRLSGPNEQLATVLETLLKLNALFSPKEVKVVSLTLSARRSWSAVLSNGMQLQLGSVDIIPRVERFIESYPFDFSANQSATPYIDLRYTNGFVVARSR